MIRVQVRLGAPLTLGSSLGPLVHGRGDPTIHLTSAEAWLAFYTDAGPATLRLQHRSSGSLIATAWGDGAAAAIEATPRILGEEDEPERLVARHPVIRELQRRHVGLRLPRTGRLFHELVPAILEQKVTGTEAFRSYAALVRRYGTASPGPAPLLLPPAPRVLAGLPYHAFHPLGVERRRADVIRRAAARADWLRAARSAEDAAGRLSSLVGIGPWTVAEVLRTAFGDPDAVSVGDYHIPNSVAWALAGEPRATDGRMLELLEPYRGQRGRVQRLLEVGRVTAPRRGPRMAPRSIAAI